MFGISAHANTYSNDYTIADVHTDGDQLAVGLANAESDFDDPAASNENGFANNYTHANDYTDADAHIDAHTNIYSHPVPISPRKNIAHRHQIS